MKNTSKLVTTLCEIGIFAALGFVFDELQGILFKGVFPSGGSIGIAMIAVLIIAYRRGLWPALLTGLIMGLLDVATSAYILHPVQMILDYIIPYALVGFAALLKPFFDKYDDKKSRILWIIAGAVVGGLLKFLSHYLAGIFFWTKSSDFAWGLENMNLYLYCFIYNIAFIGPSIVLCVAFMVPLYLKAPKVFLVKKEQVEETSEVETVEKTEEAKNPFPMILSIATMVFGTFVFIFYLIKYIRSFSDYPDEYNGHAAYGYDFDPDSMLIFVLGLFLVVLGANNLVKYFKNKFSYVLYSGVLSTILFASLVYDISRLVRMYVKGKDPTLYWIWFVIGLLSLGGAVIFFVLSYIKKKKEKAL